MIKTSEAGILFIKAREGYTPVPRDDNGHRMWGHGHDQKPDETEPEFISRDEADLLLRQDLARYVDPHLDQLCPADATQNQVDACASFCYNEGAGALATMLHHGWDQVPVQMPAWHWEHINGVLHDNAGLAARRALEVNLFNTR